MKANGKSRVMSIVNGRSAPVVRRFPMLVLPVLVLTLILGAAAPVGALTYGTAEADIAAFQSPTGNWSFWMGWDATFSETYDPTNETYAWDQFAQGKAAYEFVQNTNTPVLLGVGISRFDMPSSIRNVQDKNLQLCRRYVVFGEEPAADSLTPLLFILLLGGG